VAEPYPVHWLRQVHGVGVVGGVAPSNGEGEQRGIEADASTSGEPGVALSVITADCAPIVLWTSDGVIGAVHAGWRGLVSGVIQATVADMRSRSRLPDSVHALLGPCIGECCYEFGEADLFQMECRYGPQVRGATGLGRPALSMERSVRAAIAECGVQWVERTSSEPGWIASASDLCTGCGGDWFSWRTRADRGRQATLIWREQ
jgi:polyphenol oxidase